MKRYSDTNKIVNIFWEEWEESGKAFRYHPRGRLKETETSVQKTKIILGVIGGDPEDLNLIKYMMVSTMIAYPMVIHRYVSLLSCRAVLQ
jgi:hypothetical protein